MSLFVFFGSLDKCEKLVQNKSRTNTVTAISELITNGNAKRVLKDILISFFFLFIFLAVFFLFLFIFIFGVFNV